MGCSLENSNSDLDCSIAAANKDADKHCKSTDTVSCPGHVLVFVFVRLISLLSIVEAVSRQASKSEYNDPDAKPDDDSANATNDNQVYVSEEHSGDC